MKKLKEVASFFAIERKKFHKALLAQVLYRNSSGIPSNSDKDNRASVDIANGIIKQLGNCKERGRHAAQTSGCQFEVCCKNFIEATFSRLCHLRPGEWSVKAIGSNRQELAQYEQYMHLIPLQKAAKDNKELAAALGNDYTITPDIVISREPELDSKINCEENLVDGSVSLRTSLRKRNNPNPILHASISCKWSIRSDRAQNSRSEALNLIRNRKGHLPHVVVITAEPTPSRIASIALGTGDIDCVYHFALVELLNALNELDFKDAKDLLSIMVDGKRLKDISDLPLDLAI